MSRMKGSVCSICYARDGARTFRSCSVQAMQRNSDILSAKEYTTAELEKLCPKFRDGDIVRFLSYGDLPNDVSFLNFCTMAEMNRNAMIALWTKRKDIVKRLHEHVPENLTLIYSHPALNPPVAPIPSGFDGLFNVFRWGYVKTHRIAINCTGKCIDCMYCYGTHKKFKVNTIAKSAHGAGGVKELRYL
jgi:hypothetical protein